jgi:hypothetical protein
MTKLRAALAWLKNAASWLFNHTGDPRVKNTLLAILAAMTLFGIVEPDRATSLRDTVMSLAL